MLLIVSRKWLNVHGHPHVFYDYNLSVRTPIMPITTFGSAGHDMIGLRWDWWTMKPQHLSCQV